MPSKSCSDWRLRRKSHAKIHIHNSQSAEQYFANLAIKVTNHATQKQLAAAVLQAHSSGCISRDAQAMLLSKLHEGVTAASLWPMLVMVECGVPCSLIASETQVSDHTCKYDDDDVPVLQHLPSAKALFEQHVLPSRPVILRNAVGSETTRLADPSFLRARCGHRRVPVKSFALDDADGRPNFVADPTTRMPLPAFLDALEEAECRGTRCPYYLGKVPLRDELPELAAALDAATAAVAPATGSEPSAARGSTPLPPMLYEKCFGPMVSQGAYTYYGCARNVTATHFDNSENLMLCLCGTKRLWLYPPKDTPYLSPAADRERTSRADAPPFRRWHELPPELQATFRGLAYASPVEVHLQAGDALYLPACWWHCVEGSRDRNMILSYWYGLHPRKPAQDANGPAVKWEAWVDRWPAPDGC